MRSATPAVTISCARGASRAHRRRHKISEQRLSRANGSADTLTAVCAHNTPRILSFASEALAFSIYKFDSRGCISRCLNRRVTCCSPDHCFLRTPDLPCMNSSALGSRHQRDVLQNLIAIGPSHLSLSFSAGRHRPCALKDAAASWGGAKAEPACPISHATSPPQRVQPAARQPGCRVHPAQQRMPGASEACTVQRRCIWRRHRGPMGKTQTFHRGTLLVYWHTHSSRPVHPQDLDARYPGGAPMPQWRS